MSRAIQPQTQQNIPGTETPPPSFDGITHSYGVWRGKQHVMQAKQTGYFKLQLCFEITCTVDSVSCIRIDCNTAVRLIYV